MSELSVHEEEQLFNKLEPVTTVHIEWPKLYEPWLTPHKSANTRGNA